MSLKLSSGEWGTLGGNPGVLSSKGGGKSMGGGRREGGKRDSQSDGNREKEEKNIATLCNILY